MNNGILQCTCMCYCIQLTSMPRNSDNNTIVKTLFTTNIPCSPPDADSSVILQYNYNGRTNYIINLLLESDPAALQALDFMIIREENHSFFQVIPAKKFVS